MEDFDLQRNIYGFSLSRLTSRILWRLKPLDMCYQVFSNNIDHYLYMLMHDQPKYILGMGTYTGTDQNLIKIETLVKNQFRNRIIDRKFSASHKHLIHPFIKQVSRTKYASGFDDSFCNLVSWKIVSLIEIGELRSQYAFLHIPKSYTSKDALAVIEDLIHDSIR